MLPYENLYLQTLEGEIWKPVVGYEGFYEVSNLGIPSLIPKKVSNKLRIQIPNGQMHHGKMYQ